MGSPNAHPNRVRDRDSVGTGEGLDHVALVFAQANGDDGVAIRVDHVNVIRPLFYAVKPLVVAWAPPPSQRQELSAPDSQILGFASKIPCSRSDLRRPFIFRSAPGASLTKEK
jgi:hypothetical protein